MTHEPAGAHRMPGARRIIGTRQVSRVAIGGASWSLGQHQDDGNVIATIHAAIDAGITTIDTARAYTTLDHPSRNEWIIARALSAHPDGDSVFVATKGGHFRRGPDDFPVDASPAALRRDASCGRMRWIDDTGAPAGGVLTPPSLAGRSPPPHDNRDLP